MCGCRTVVALQATLTGSRDKATMYTARCQMR
jgi:hypothetical protein